MTFVYRITLVGILLIIANQVESFSYINALSQKTGMRIGNTALFSVGRDRSSRSKDSSRSRSSQTRSTPTDGIRQARVARNIRDELAEIICEGDVKANAYPSEDLLRGTSIADVEISGDLTTAKVFISVIGNSVEKRQVFVWLCENVGQVRFELAKRLKHMRRIPEITFRLSDTKAASDLVTLIDGLAPKPSVLTDEENIEFVEIKD